MSIRTVGTLLALTGALAACTAEQKPTVLPPAPSVSASISASASPTPVAPLPVPPEAQEATSQGASAFARYYMDVLGRAIQTVDPAPIRSLSDSGCGGCQNLIRAIEVASDKGQRVRGAAFRVLFAVAPAVQDGDVVVDLRYERLQGELIDADDAVSRIEPEKPVDAEMRLMWADQGWIVLGFRTSAIE